MRVSHSTGGGERGRLLELEGPMRLKLLPLAIVAGVGMMTFACGDKKPEGPSREVLEAQLRQEAEALKKGGEDIPPSFGVKATWTIESVEIREQPDNPEVPWTGSIHFQIRSVTRQPDGKHDVDESERTFEYVYNTTLNQWLTKVE
jgi:hypothetical protein